MNHKSLDLYIIFVISVGILLTTMLPEVSRTVAWIFALPLVLALPGYTLAAALFPRFELERSDRILLSSGLSVAITGIGGLILHLTPQGIQMEPWLILLSTITMVSCAIALVRRIGFTTLPKDNLFKGLDTSSVFLFLLAAVVIIFAFGVAYSSAAIQPAKAFTQLWVLPGSTENPAEAVIGVRSMEPEIAKFRLRVESSGIVIQEWPLIVLGYGEVWQTKQTVSVTSPGSTKVEVLLYRYDLPDEVYRQGVIWLEAN